MLADPGPPLAAQMLPDLGWLGSAKGPSWPAPTALPARWELSPCGSESVVPLGSIVQGLLHSAG